MAFLCVGYAGFRAKKVASYTDGLVMGEFVANNLVYDATIRNLELIGEAATHIPLEARSQYPAIPWRMLIATRNRLIHGYLGIDNDTLWSLVAEEVPVLIDQLIVVLESIDTER